MKTVGIVAEYNPFHTGHAHQIAQTKKLLGGNAAVICVMSGNWVQQADCAIFNKWLRARLALMGGADLVIELPTVWSVSSAESFARGSIALLSATGVVDFLSFGSECGDTEKLKQAAVCLDDPDYPSALRPLLDQGKPFAVCRQEAVERLVGQQTGSLLRNPNNNLGVEYIRALKSLNSPILPLTVRREGASHNSMEAISFFQRNSSLSTPSAPFASATQIRQHLMTGSWKAVEPYLLPGAGALLRGNFIGWPSLVQIERAILARLRTMTSADWAALPESSAAEGLPERLSRAGHQARTIEDFFHLAKTKRYTYARLRRLILWAYWGLTAAHRPHHPPYLRVLGCNETGRTLLKQMKKRATLPIITKPTHVRRLSSEAQALFELESRCTDLYTLCFSDTVPGGLEWITSPILL